MEALVRVLTEPRNSLVRQYEQLFQLSGVELRFTSGALREVARSADGMGTGARGLRTCVERLLGEAMFEAPGEFVFLLLGFLVCLFPFPTSSACLGVRLYHPLRPFLLMRVAVLCVLGSSIKYILVTAAVAMRKSAPVYFARGQQHLFHNLIAAEEEEWEKGRREREGGGGGGEVGGGGEGRGTFEEYREKSKAAGVM